MQKQYRKAWLVGLLVAVVFSGTQSAQAGSIKINLYGSFGPGGEAIPGEAVSDLLSHASFPDNPAVTSDQQGVSPLVDFLQFPVPFDEGGIADEYGSMAEGFLEVPQDGEYQFFLRGDNGVRFDLSPDSNPANAETRAEVPGDACCDPFVEDGVRNSEPISLSQGNQYYFRVVHKEASGGDFWQVGWTGPGIPEPEPIPLRFAQAFVEESGSPIIAAGPQDQTVSERRTVIFSVDVNALPPVQYQWFENGSLIEGANNSFLRIENASVSQDQTTFRVEVTPSDAETVSAEATLTVNRDTVAPTINEATTQGNPNGLQVTFSEPVEQASALNPDNYAIGNGVSIESVSQVNDSTVQLTTSTIADEGVYVLTVNNVRDLAEEPNTIEADTQVEFLQTHGVITRRVYTGIDGGELASMRAATKFPNNPDLVTYPTLMETPPDFAESYGVQLAGTLTAPTTGEYIFYLSSDDQGALFLSSDEDPANATEIATEPVWSGNRVFLGDADGRRNADEPENISDPITLEAGQRYYIEAQMKEGVGGDNLAVAWKKPNDPEPTENADLAPIPGEFLSSLATTGPVTITDPPTDTTAPELGDATFSVSVDGTPPYQYQWLKNGEPIDGATGPTLALSNIPLSDDDAAISVRASNRFSEITSSGATLTVEADTEAPGLVNARGMSIVNEIHLTFNEPLAPDAATNLGNYSIEDLELTDASLSDDGLTVTLTTGTQEAGTEWTLSISGIIDRAAGENSFSGDVTFTTVDGLQFGLQGHWDFKDPTSLSQDTSPNAIKLSTVGNPEFSPERGGAVLLDGSSAFVGDTFPEGIPTGESNYTLAAWIRPTGTGPLGIIGWGAYGTGGEVNALRLFGENGFRHYWWANDLDGDASTLDIDLFDGDWHHVAATYDGETRTIWLDSQELISDSPVAPNAQPLNFAVGRTWPGGNEFFTGELDDVRVYNRALSEEAVTALMDLPLPDAATAPPSVLIQPDDLTRRLGESATFSVTAVGQTPLNYQWSKDGEPLEGETSRELTLDDLESGDAGEYTVDISNTQGSTSSTAVLTIESDNTAPKVLEARAFAEVNRIRILFSEPLKEDTATDTAHYTIEGLSVNQAQLDAEQNIVTLQTEAQTLGNEVTLTIESVEDLAGNAFSGSLSLTSKSEVGYGLQGHWEFNDSSDLAKDSSLNRISLTTTEGIGYSTERGGALTLDGESGMLTTDTFPEPIPTGDTPYTVAAWIKPTESGAQGIIGWGAYGNGGEVNAFRLFGDNGFRHYWWANDLDADASANNVDLFDGNWHHAAATFDGETRTIWLDGQELASDSPGAPNIQPANFAIGRTFPGGNEFFTGQLDGVRVYDRALTGPLIQELFNQPVPIALTLDIRLDADEVVLEWQAEEATLEQADEVEGPYEPVPDATSPHTVSPTDGDTRFFRLSQ